MSNHADHLLHFTPGMYGGSYRLECLPHGEHFTADLEEWSGTAEEMEAKGVIVDRTKCWVHDWLDNADNQIEFLNGDDWTEDGPWPVICSYKDGLNVEMAVVA
jgi:hypothetical protein